MDSGAWRAAVHGVAESNMTATEQQQTTHGDFTLIFHLKMSPLVMLSLISCLF